MPPRAVEDIPLADLTRQRLCMFTAHRLFVLPRARRLAQALFSVPRHAQASTLAPTAAFPQGLRNSRNRSDLDHQSGPQCPVCIL